MYKQGISENLSEINTYRKYCWSPACILNTNIVIWAEMQAALLELFEYCFEEP